MEKNKIINVGIYVRVSTEDQKEYGYSISQQIDILTALANSNNWNIYKIYNDAGISGKNTEDRPMLKELIDDIKKNKINKVLITKMDRLSRNVVDTETLLNIFNSFDCELLDSNGKVIESDNPSGWLYTIMQSVFGQYERKAIISRVKDGFAGKVKQGKSLCSYTPPYGYDKKSGESILSINEYESFIVKRIYRMYLDGHTFTEISRILNAEKIKTKLNGKVITKKDIVDNIKEYVINSRWMPKTIRLILTNPTYIGKVRYHINRVDYKEYDGLHEPIISIDLYNEVQDKIKKIKNVSRTNKPKEQSYYCGTLICGYCQKKITTKRTIKKKSKGEKIVYLGYRCINKEKGLCVGKGMSHKKVEQAFLEYIYTIDNLNISNIKIDDIENKDNKEIETLIKSINLLKIKKKEIMNLFLEDKITDYEIQYMNNELDKKIDILKLRLSKLKNELSKKTPVIIESIKTAIKDHWQCLNNREKLEFLNEFIEYIMIINDGEKKGKLKILEVKFYD